MYSRCCFLFFFFADDINYISYIINARTLQHCSTSRRVARILYPIWYIHAAKLHFLSVSRSFPSCIICAREMITNSQFSLPTSALPRLVYCSPSAPVPVNFVFIRPKNITSVRWKQIYRINVHRKDETLQVYRNNIRSNHEFILYFSDEQQSFENNNI